MGVTDLTARRNLLFNLLDAQERAADWNDMGETLTAIDGIAPALTTEYEIMHPALERARWLSHQNRAAEARKILRELSDQAMSRPAATETNVGPVTFGGEPSGVEAALQEIAREQTSLHHFDDAVLTAQRFSKPERVNMELYRILWAQAQAGDAAGALRDADLTGDPLNRVQALLGLAQERAEKRKFTAALANQQEALRFALTLPEGKPRHDALGMLISELRWSDTVPGLLRIADASTDAAQRDEARAHAAESLWKQAKTGTASARAAQVEPLAAAIKDAEERRMAYRYAVMLQAWGGDPAGAKAVAARTLDRQDPALLLLIGERLRDMKNSSEAWTLQDHAQEAAQGRLIGSADGRRTAETFFAALFAGVERQDVLSIADRLPISEYRFPAYRFLARNAAAIKDAAVLRALWKRIDAFYARPTDAPHRAEFYVQFADVYAAAGQTQQVLRFMQALPEPRDRARTLTEWGAWQAKIGAKSAAKTLLDAEAAAAQIAALPDRMLAQLEIIKALTKAESKPEAAALLAQVVADTRAASGQPDTDAWRLALALAQSEAGDAAGALQTARTIPADHQQGYALTTIAEDLNRRGRVSEIAPVLSAMLDEPARRDLLIRLAWQGEGDRNAARKQQYLGLATDDRDRAAVLLAFAQRQASSNDRITARVTVEEAAPLIAKIPPGLPRIYAQVQAAKLLISLSREAEGRALLAASAEQILRAMQPGKQKKWNLPPTEPYTGTRLSAENEWEVELMDIAEAQSGTGDLEAALETIRHLRVSDMRRFALYENVRDWINHAAMPRDMALLTKWTRPDERPYALLTAANALLPPVNIGF